MDVCGKPYRAWDANRGRQQACVPDEILPQDDLVFFLLDTIPQLDLSAFHNHYQGELRGQPPFDVTMMVTLLVYSYSVGVYSSRKIAAACERNLAFRVIVADDPPDFRTISDFRKIHTAAMKPLFLVVLRLAGELGMVRLGNLSTDGTKIDANASRHKAMSYGYMEKEVERLKGEIDELLQWAGQIDAEQDASLGSRRGDELPDELKRREERLEKILAARARLEAEAQARAEEEQRRRDEADAAREAEGRSRRGKAPQPVDPTPQAKAQANFTDEESKIMKQSNKGFGYCYNCQAVVDGAFQIIVEADVTTDANDKRQAAPRARATLENLEAAGIERVRDAAGEPIPIPNTADSGYFSEEAVAEVARAGLDPYFALGRQKHHATAATAGTSDTTAAVSATPASAAGAVGSPTSDRTAAATTTTSVTTTAAANTTGNPCAGATTPEAKEKSVKERMQEKLKTETGRALYAARKHIVEPVFGQIKHVRSFRKFLRRGVTNVKSEWELVSLTHNLLKIHRYASS